MKLIKGSIKEDRGRDLFWQRSFVEDDQGKILFKIIICATQEFLSMALKKRIENVKMDNDMGKWFEDKTEKLFEKSKSRKDLTGLESLFDIYPQTETMLKFAQAVE